MPGNEGYDEASLFAVNIKSLTYIMHIRVPATKNRRLEEDDDSDDGDDARYKRSRNVELQSIHVKNIATLLRTRMNGTTIEEMNYVLWSTDAVIAGSSVIQSILNLSWENINVDLWLPASEFNSLRTIQELLYKHGYNYQSTKIVENCRELYRYVHTITTFFGGSKRLAVQIMHVHSGVTTKDVVESFDIRATQFLYDGHQIVEVGDDSLDELITGTMKFSDAALNSGDTHEWIRTIERVKKYASRGFRLPSSDEWNNIATSIFHTLVKEYNHDDHDYDMQDTDLVWFIDKWNKSAGSTDIPHFERKFTYREESSTRLQSLKLTGIAHFIVITNEVTKKTTGEYTCSCADASGSSSCGLEDLMMSSSI